MRLYHLTPLVRLHLHLLCLCLGPLFCISVPESSTLLLSTLPSTSSVSLSVPRSPALLLFALLSASGVSVPVPGSSAFLSSAFLFPFDVSVPVPGSSTSLFMSSVFGVSVSCLGCRLHHLCLVCLCLCLGCPLRRFLYGLIRKHQCLFREDKD